MNARVLCLLSLAQSAAGLSCAADAVRPCPTDRYVLVTVGGAGLTRIPRNHPGLPVRWRLALLRRRSEGRELPRAHRQGPVGGRLRAARGEPT